MARNFDGTADHIIVSAGALVGMTFGAFACIIRRGATGAWHGLVGIEDGGGAAKMNLEITDANVLNYNVDGGGGASGSTTITSTTTWYFVAADKATGTATPRFHIYNYSNNTWTHENAGGTQGNTAATIAQARLGRWQTVDDYNGDMAIAGIWENKTFTDAQWEAMGLPFSLAHWHAAQPTAFWVLDQQATGQSVRDLTGGGANQTGISGTSVATNSVPVFSYGEGDISIVLPPATGGGTITATGITSAEAFGTAQINLTVNPTAIASAEAFGTPIIQLVIAPTAVASLEAFGTHQINLSINAAGGLASEEAFGDTVVQSGLQIFPSGIVSLEEFGAATINQTITAIAIATAEAFGTATVQLGIAPAGIGSLEAFGSHRIMLGISPSGIASVEAFGDPTIQGPIFIFAGPIASAEAFGSHIVNVGLLAIINSARGSISPMVTLGKIAASLAAHAKIGSRRA